MDGWAGFTDSDLKKLKKSDAIQEGNATRSPPPRKPPTPQQSHAASGRRPGLGARRQMVGTRQTTPPKEGTVSPSMLLSKSQEQKKVQISPSETTQTRTGSGSTTTGTQPHTGSHGHSPDGTSNQSQDGSTSQPQVDKTDSQISTENDEGLILDDKEIFKHEQHTLVSFQKQQKMIEELNKKKRQMLATAIKERSQKAKAESSKLIEIQQELGKLDHTLTVDVSIMRDKIENSSREYYEAHKRYDKAEKEFIEAKVDLHHKMEVKEQLTEHLYTVIYQNEMRKSKRLAELMEKLEMECMETPDVPECDMPHPSLISPVQLPPGRYGHLGHLASPPSSPPTPPDQQNAKEQTDKSQSPSADQQSTKEQTDKARPSSADQQKSADQEAANTKPESNQNKQSDNKQGETKEEKSTDKTESETKTQETEKPEAKDADKDSVKNETDINQNKESVKS